MLKSNQKGILLMLLSSIFVCVGQLFWKLSVNGDICMLLAGFFFYGIGALSMLIAYRYGELSVLQPILSLNYVIAMFLAVIVLKESVTILQCVGVVTIISGVVLIAGSQE